MAGHSVFIYPSPPVAGHVYGFNVAIYPSLFGGATKSIPGTRVLAFCPGEKIFEHPGGAAAQNKGKPLALRHHFS